MGSRFWLSGGGIALTLVSCGIDEAVGVDRTEHALDPAFEPVMSAYCESLFRCDWPDTALRELRILSGSPDGCRTLVHRTRDSAPNHDLDVAIAEGRIRIVTENVTDCVRSIDACRPYALDDSSACGALFEGTLVEGARCQRSEECAGDAYCRSDNLQCPGACTPHTPPGGRCKSSQECGAARGSIPLCVSAATAVASVCTEIPILDPVELGQACVLTSSGNPVVPCAPGLWCDYDFAVGAGVCRRPIPLGERCGDRDVCEGGALCHGSPGVCRAASVARAVGSACDPRALVWCDALDHLTCVDGTCEVIGDGTPGSDCDPSELHAGSCREGFHCRSSADARLGTCTRLGGEGEPCAAGEHCLSGSCRLDGTCAAGYCAPY